MSKTKVRRPAGRKQNKRVVMLNRIRIPMRIRCEASCVRSRVSQIKARDRFRRSLVIARSEAKRRPALFENPVILSEARAAGAVEGPLSLQSLSSTCHAERRIRIPMRTRSRSSLRFAAQPKGCQPPPPTFPATPSFHSRYKARKSIRFTPFTLLS